MAMILEAFVQVFTERLIVLANDNISMILGVKKDLEDLKSELDLLADVLNDAESRKIHEIAIRTWVVKLREIMYDADDLLDDCNVEGDKLLLSSTSTSTKFHIKFFKFSCFRELKFKHKIAKRIRAISSDLDKMYKQTSILGLVQRQGHPFAATLSRRPRPFVIMADEDIVGIDEDANLLVDLVIGGNDTTINKSKCPIYAITGMPGIGKTTLAQKMYHDPQVKTHFQVTIWLCVSAEYNPVELLKQIGRSAKRSEGDIKAESYSEGDIKAETYTEAAEIVRCLLDSKRLLLVLDDVWDSRVWEQLSFPMATVANGSKVVVTTRNAIVAQKMGAVYTHIAREFTVREGWLMLRRQVFKDDDDQNEIESLEKTGMEIVRNCNGIPLAIKTIAGLLKTRERSVRAWEGVWDSRMWTLDNLDNYRPGLLSYEDLPPHLKQCFLYCSLFPEDYKFHHETLVQMWIAEGLVMPNGQRELEEIGDGYYRELVMRNLLQAVPEYYDETGCTMHDLVRALAQHISRSGAIFLKPRHLFFVKKDSNEVPDISTKECLRTLLMSKNPQIKSIPQDYFSKLRHLRVLDLTYMGIKNLPESLGNLVQLRFLNVAFTKLRELPESIAKLRNLETLKANDLKYMEKLPDGIVHLSNLRHLNVGSAQKQLKSMPAGIGNLRQLRTLSGFIVNDGCEADMQGLQHLQNLTHLSMYRLEKVAGEEEAKAAKLAEKGKLNFLRLSCTRIVGVSQLEECELVRIQKVFEGLQPPRNLDALHIDGFFGVELPSCIRNCSLRNLNWLRLDDCKFIEQLPPLGRLPCLRALHIWGAISVSKIGKEFFSGSAPGTVGFPALIEFYLKGMTKLKEIAAIEHGTLPRLKKLQVIRCPKLSSLPDGLENATKLTHLLVEDAESITEIKSLTTVSELKLNGNSKLKVISDLASLNYLTICNCHALTEVNCSNVLSYLSISDDKMQDLPEWLKNITSLRRLDVKGSHELVTGCVITGSDWPKIQHVLHLQARTHDGSNYISYRKEPFFFQSNLTAGRLVDQPSSSNFCALDDEELSYRFSL